jgi:hypothetical protein
VGLGQLITHPMGLDHGQLAAARCDAQGVGHQDRITAAQPKEQRAIPATSAPDRDQPKGMD